MGHPHARTPNIDRLASESLLLTRGYVPSSLCRPSLASIMTGLYPHQHLITGNDPPGKAMDPQNRASMVEIFRKSKTIVGELGEAGYVSHQSGKWWEGECTCCGFTECMSHGDVSRGGRHGDVGLKIGRETMQPVFDFVDRAAGKPFLLWYAPMMPHQPHNPPARILEKYVALRLPEAQAKYLGMIEWFDETVGQLVAHLESKGLADNTLFVYLADNGWVQLEGKQTLFATRAKLSPYDAGLRTPIFYRWKGHITPRRDDRTLATSLDIAPTVLAAAGRKAPSAWEGVNVMDGARLRKRQWVAGSNFVHTSIDIRRPSANLKYRWIVRGEWKLVVPYEPNLELPVWEQLPDKAWSRKPELFDSLRDPREKIDMAAARPEVVRSLLADLDRWWTP